MSRYFAIRDGLMTFAFGLATVSFLNQFNFTQGFYDVTQEEMDRAVFVIKSPFFVATGRGCGNGGYAQSYEAYNGQWLMEGATSLSTAEFKRSLTEAEIIERVEKSPNRFGELGLRLITRNRGKDGNFYFEILWFAGDKLLFISAPTLEIATEFEQSNSYAF